MGLLDALRAGRWCDLRCTFHSTRLLPSRPSLPPLLCGRCQPCTAAPSPPSTQWGLLLGCPSQGSCSPCLLLPSHAAAADRVDALAWHPPHLSMQVQSISIHERKKVYHPVSTCPAENIEGEGGSAISSPPRTTPTGAAANARQTRYQDRDLPTREWPAAA